MSETKKKILDELSKTTGGFENTEFFDIETLKAEIRRLRPLIEATLCLLGENSRLKSEARHYLAFINTLDNPQYTIEELNEWLSDILKYFEEIEETNSPTDPATKIFTTSLAIIALLASFYGKEIAGKITEWSKKAENATQQIAENPHKTHWELLKRTRVKIVQSTVK